MKRHSWFLGKITRRTEIEHEYDDDDEDEDNSNDEDTTVKFRVKYSDDSGNKKNCTVMEL